MNTSNTVALGALLLSADMMKISLFPVNVHCNEVAVYNIQCWTKVEDIGPTLYKCYTNVLCLLGMIWRLGLYMYSI